MNRTRRHLACTLAAACATALPLLASAQATPRPDKPVTLLIPYPPGGSADLLARPLSIKLQERLGQPMVLDYKPGAGGTVASQLLARAKPDGNTLIMVLAAHAINPSLYGKLPYDSRKDFAPVSLVANLPMVLAGSKSLKANTVPELIAEAKANPGKITFGSAGNGNTGHLAGEYFSTLAGVKMTHVPYKGSSGVVNAMLGGEIDLTFDSISTSMPQIASGRMKALATTGTQRSAIAQQVPTMQEAGVAGFVVQGWYAILAPAGTPPTVVNRLSTDIAAALKEPDLKDTLAASGYEPVGSTPAELGTHIERETVRWAKVVKESGARVD